MDDISNFIFLDGSHISGIQGFYGYFESFPEGPVLIAGARYASSDDAEPTEFAWYKLAVEASGNIVETTPTISNTNVYWMTKAED